MKGINYVCLSGNLGAEPELRHTKAGAAVAELRLATSRVTSHDGETKQETEWTTVKVWSQRAEFAGAHLHKGDPIIIQGRLHTEKWTNEKGDPRWRTTVIAHDLTALPRAARDKASVTTE